MVIAVDAVGGDYFPENPVHGAILATEEDSTLEILLVGPRKLIQDELDKHTFDSKRITILDAPEIIGMDESPSTAVKSKVNSSITIGIGAHKKNHCAAFVSAGNTGALLAASTFILGKLPGVLRPTIAAVFPTIKGVRLLLDAGANLDLKPEMYVQFAKMGLIFAKEILDVADPKVGLINIGAEPEKGTEIHKEVYKLLSSLSAFNGNIEGKDILFAKTDVFLTDGFTGNTILKFGESFPDALKHLLTQTMKEERVAPDLQKTIYQLLSKALHTFDYEPVGGVPFLGVNGTSLVAHGGSSPVAIKNMIINASQCVKNEVNKKIIASLNQ